MSIRQIAILDSKQTNNVQQYSYAIVENFKNIVSSGIAIAQDIINITANTNAKPVNFCINMGKIEDKWGSFSRLENKQGVVPKILIAEYRSANDRLLAYIILEKNGAIKTVKREQLLSLCEQAKSRNVALIQNAIYRVLNGVPQLAAYEGCVFPKVIQKLNKKLPEAKPAPHIENPVVPDKQPIPQEPVAAKTSVQPEAKKTAQPVPKPPKKEYTDAQKRELIACRKNGVDEKIISSPELSPEQMRVIWVAKKNGMASEYFANPKFSVEQMQFYADRLVDRKVFLDCKGLINPKYSVEQLAELYHGVCDGIDYTLYADEKLSAEEMYVKRVQLGISTYANCLASPVDAVEELRGKELFLSRLKQ